MDTGGNCYVTGYFKSPTATFGNFTLLNSSSTNSADVFVAKYDPAGNVLWAKQAGGADVDYGYSIAVDTSGNSYLSGVFSRTATFGSIILNNPGTTHFIAKYGGSAGTVQWAQAISGGTDDGSSAVAVDAAGNGYFTGWFSGTASFGNTNLTSMGLDDLFVAKFDSGGHQLWVKQAGGNDYDRGYGIAVDNFGDTYVAGFFASSCSFDNFMLNSSGGFDSFLAKLDGPRLSIAHIADQVIITWPTNAAGLVLQSTTNLATSRGWITSSNAFIVGDHNAATNSIDARARFYRLKNP